MFSTDLAKSLKVDCVCGSRWKRRRQEVKRSIQVSAAGMRRAIIYSVLTWVHLPLCLMRKCMKYEFTIGNGHERRGSTHRLWLVKETDWDLTSEKKGRTRKREKELQEVHYETCWREELAKEQLKQIQLKSFKWFFSLLWTLISRRRKRHSFLFLTNKTNSCSLTLDHRLSVSLLPSMPCSVLFCSRLSFWLSIHLGEKKHSQEEGRSLARGNRQKRKKKEQEEKESETEMDGLICLCLPKRPTFGTDCDFPFTHASFHQIFLCQSSNRQTETPRIERKRMVDTLDETHFVG